jgi:hypothetical protein
MIFRVIYLEELPNFALIDKGRDAAVAKHIALGWSELFIIPPANLSLFPNSPLYYWILSSLFFVLRSYYFINIVWAILGTINILLAYRIVSKIYNRLAALIAAFLVATSAVHIFYSREIWQPNILPFFVLFIFYFNVKYLEQKKIKQIIFSLVTSFTALLIHNSFIILLPLFIFYSFYILIKTKKNLVVFFIILLLGFYAWMQLVFLQSKDYSLQVPSKFITSQVTQNLMPLYILENNLNVIFNELAGENQNLHLFMFQNVSVYLVIIISLILSIYFSNNEFHKNIAIFFLLLMSTQIILSLIGPKKVHPHYFISYYPLLLIFFVSIPKLLRLKELPSQLIVLLIVCIHSITNIPCIKNVLYVDPLANGAFVSTIAHIISQDAQNHSVSIENIGIYTFDQNEKNVEQFQTASGVSVFYFLEEMHQKKLIDVVDINTEYYNIIQPSNQKIRYILCYSTYSTESECIKPSQDYGENHRLLKQLPFNEEFLYILAFF